MHKYECILHVQMFICLYIYICIQYMHMHASLYIYIHMLVNIRNKYPILQCSPAHEVILCSPLQLSFRGYVVWALQNSDQSVGPLFFFERLFPSALRSPERPGGLGFRAADSTQLWRSRP